MIEKERLKKLLETTLAAETRISRTANMMSEITQGEDEEGISVPALNELRYVTNHLLKALTTDDTDKEIEQLNEAFDHAERAGFDAIELGIIISFERIQSFLNDYRRTMIPSVVPDYTKYLETVHRIRREANSVSYRDTNMEQADKWFEGLRRIGDEFDLARPTLNKLKNKRVWKLVGGILAGAGAIATIVALIVTLA